MQDRDAGSRNFLVPGPGTSPVSSRAVPRATVGSTYGSPTAGGDPEPVGDTVGLTVTYDDLPADQYEGTARGWVKVLSSLKSLLETGQALPTPVLYS